MTDEKPKASMQEAVGEKRERLKTPPMDLEAALQGTAHKLTDYSPGAHKYVRQHRLSLVIKHGRSSVVKQPVSAYQVVTHRDQYDVLDPDGRSLVVDSDESVIVIIARTHDSRNKVGRSMREGRAKPISTLKQTLETAGLLSDIDLSIEEEQGE